MKSRSNSCHEALSWLHLICRRDQWLGKVYIYDASLPPLFPQNLAPPAPHLAGPPKYSDVNQSAADFCWLNILKFPRIVVFFDIYVDVVGYFIYSHCLPWSTQQTHLVQFTAEAPPSSADRPNLNAEINMGSCIVSDIFRKPKSYLSESPPRHPLSPSCPTLSVYLYCMLLVMNLARSPLWFICSQSASSRRPKQEPTIIIWINWNFLSCR